MSNCFKRIVPFFVFVIAFVSLSSFLPKHVNAATCNLQPEAPWIKATSGPGAGQVTLWWKKVNYANRYAVSYGTASNQPMYGSNWIGGENAESYTVSSLVPGQTYYFRVAAAHDSCSSPYSNEVWAVAGGGPAVSFNSSFTMAQNPAVAGPSLSSGPVGKQMLWVKSGPGVGEATLYWKDADSASNYHLVYGTEHGKFQYGALNIGNVKWFTVRHLNPGTSYHFALIPLVGDRPLYTTEQVMAKAWMPETLPATETDVMDQVSETEEQSVNVAEPMTDGVVEVMEDDSGFTGGARRVGSPNEPGSYAPDGSYYESVQE